MSITPVAGCSLCGALQKRYENALLEEMQAMAHESAVRAGNAQAAKARGDNPERACHSRTDAREALQKHVFLKHPEIARVELIG